MTGEVRIGFFVWVTTAVCCITLVVSLAMSIRENDMLLAANQRLRATCGQLLTADSQLKAADERLKVSSASLSAAADEMHAPSARKKLSRLR